MGAHIEWVTGVLRVGRKFKTYGDPFEFSCTVLRDGDTVTFLGASAATLVNLAMDKASVRQLLKPLGIKRVQWIRIKNGKRRRVVAKL